MTRLLNRFASVAMTFVAMTFAAILLCGAATMAQPPAQRPAQRPPMGWNSWDSYGLTIDEAQFRANAEVLRARLLPYGWRYAVIDEGWYFENPLERPHPEKLLYDFDRNGRYIPVPSRFPSAKTKIDGAADRRDGQSNVEQNNLGFAPLADSLHRQGLLFGLHIVRGIPRESVRMNLPIADSNFKAQDAFDGGDACPWDPTNWGVKDNAAGQAWYDSVVKQYAGWGVDLLKVDCISDHPYRASEIQQLRRAIAKSGRPMVLSLSPGPTNLSHAEEVGQASNMWRISEDIWDIWEKADDTFPNAVKSQFARLAAWEKFARPGAWPDADMLPFGELRPRPDIGPGPRHTRLTDDEEQTQITLWSIARSPLILGANLTLLDESLARLLTNADVLRVDQTATGSRQVLQEGNMIVWTSDLPGGERAVGVFNVGDSELKVTKAWAELVPEKGTGKLRVRDAWKKLELGTSQTLSCVLPRHGSAMFLVR